MVRSDKGRRDATEPKKKAAAGPQARKRGSVKKMDTGSAALTTEKKEKVGSENQPERNNEQSNTRGSPSWITKAHIILQAIIAAASIAALIVLVFELGEFQEQTRLNREALTGVQRAFVFVTPVPSFVSDADPFLTISAKWENSGNTPARDLKVKIFCYSYPAIVERPENLPSDLDRSNIVDEEWKRVLGPNSITIGGNCSITKSAVAGVIRGDNHVYFLASATYRDIFDDKRFHTTKYCAELTIRVDEKGTPIGSTSPCRTHNCYDEECKDSN